MPAICQLRIASRAFGKTFSMRGPNTQFSRRRFLQSGFCGASLCVLGVSTAGSKAVGAGTPASQSNPLVYNVDQMTGIDPTLIQYEQVRAIPGVGAGSRRLAIGPEGRLYVAGRKGIRILETTGNPVGELPTSEPARCVAVAADGGVYAGTRTHIEVFSSKGEAVAKWEQPSPKTWLSGLSFSSSGLFAADSGNRVILRYDLEGKLVRKIGQKDPQRNIPGLIVPSPYLDVKVGADGLLRVNDPGRHRVDVFTAEGDLELSWGKPSLSIDGFCGCCNPVGLAPLPSGRWLTCEKGVPRVKIYSAEHALECVVAGPDLFVQNGRPGQVSDQPDGTLGGLDAVVDSKGVIYVLDLVAGDVRVMERKA